MSKNQLIEKIRNVFDNVFTLYSPLKKEFIRYDEIRLQTIMNVMNYLESQDRIDEELKTKELKIRELEVKELEVKELWNIIYTRGVLMPIKNECVAAVMTWLPNYCITHKDYEKELLELLKMYENINSMDID